MLEFFRHSHFTFYYHTYFSLLLLTLPLYLTVVPIDGQLGRGLVTFAIEEHTKKLISILKVRKMHNLAKLRIFNIRSIALGIFAYM